MFKNFSPHALGINGRQSELIELALTYGFRGMDVDMNDMFRRSRRTSAEDASKYLKAADIKIGCYDVDADLDADNATFESKLATVQPVAELAQQLGASRASIRVPVGTDSMPMNQFFDVVRSRIAAIADALATNGIKLGVGFRAGKELQEGKQYPFISDIGGFLGLMKSIHSKNVGITLDTFEWAIGGGTNAQVRALSGDEIVSVRLGSVAKDLEGPATSQDRVLPGHDGGLDLVSVIKHLSSAGFKGPVSPSASSKRYKGQTRENIVNQAQEAIDGLFREAGLHVAPRPMDLIEDIPYEPMMRE